MGAQRTQEVAAAAVTASFGGLARSEDRALLTGVARFADDLAVAPGTLHAAILRSPHAHAELLGIDARAALTRPGVVAIVTGEDARVFSSPFLVGVKAPMDYWCLALDRVRYVGEPVAVVLASDRYQAEDALDAIEVHYRPLPAVVTVEEACGADTPILHPRVGSNVVSTRDFTYGDPDAVFAHAPHRIGLTVRYPRNAVTPIECYVVLAEFDSATQAYEVTANFSGPFALMPVMARALNVPVNRLRLKTPPYAGGSFGVKQGVFPYVVLMGVCARKTGRPVKWVEDRLEHLMAATSATGRVTRLEAAVAHDGEILALRMEQTEDCGAYLRAPEPASLYRNHGNLTGGYRIPHLAVTNRVVLTNKTPSGLSRGFGGGQLYFGLERLVHKIALTLGRDPLEVIRHNLLRAEDMPYRTASGGLLESGDYARTVEMALAKGNLAELVERRRGARTEGRLYGIGYAAVVEPSISNMGYITTVLTPEERRKAGPKSGAQSTATVSLDPLGAVTVTADSVPQGQGHRTVLAQVVAETLGLALGDIVVNVELDTQKDAWSIASGNYSSRFAGAVAGAAHLAATRLKEKLACIAAGPLNTTADQVRFANGRVFSEGNPDNAISFSRLAATSHWAPGTLPEGTEAALRETAFWTPPQLKAPDERDAINSSGAYGFIFDFCGVEVDRDTGHVRIDKYVTAHDAGRLLNPLLANGQIYGAFANAVGAAFYEEFQYGADGRFLSGTFADYLVPTVDEVPEPIILHLESPSPYTPLGAKGLAEGNCMSTPVCIANAVADALGVGEVTLPLTPARVAAFIHGVERSAPASATQLPPRAGGTGRALTGEGTVEVPAPPERVWSILLDPVELAGVLPGCEKLEQIGAHAYRAEVTVGIGPVRGRYLAEVELFDLKPPHALILRGAGNSALGTGRGEARVALESTSGGTRVQYRYSADVGGKVAAVGGRMLESAARILIGQFFERLVVRANGVVKVAATGRLPWWRRLLRLLGLSP